MECESSEHYIVGSTDELTKSNYFEFFSGGGVTAPSIQMTEFVSSSFPILGFADKFIDMHLNENTRNVSREIQNSVKRDEVVSFKNRES